MLHFNVRRPHHKTRQFPMRSFGLAVYLGLILATFAWVGELHASEPSFITVQAQRGSSTLTYEGSVEAVRQAEVAAQVAGSVVQLSVKAGDLVRAGQTLVRLDARAAEQNATASAAQVNAARASQDVAVQELNRKQQLFAKKYIAKAALEQAEAAHRAAQAQVNALAAQAGAARTQAGLHAVTAPFDGVIARISVEKGDMAMPGRPLLMMYDPAALRVAAAVPVTALGRGVPRVQVELAGHGVPIEPKAVKLLPIVDAASLTQVLRAELPVGVVGAVPGQFARLTLLEKPTNEPQGSRIFVPQAVIVHRAELKGLYVLNAQGKAVLRQVRLGPRHLDQVEVLSGLSAGERVLLRPSNALSATQESGAP